MKIIKPFRLMLGIIVCLTGMAAADSNWVIIGSDDGLTTYTIPQSESELCAVRGIGFVEAPMDVLIAVIRDISAYPEWSAMCTSTEVLKYINRNNQVFYSVMNPPFSLRDRDMVVNKQMTFDFRHGTAQIDFSTTDKPQIPLKGGCLRIKDFTAQYRLEFFGRNRTRVTYEQESRQEGDVQECPADNLKGLREMVKKERYLEKARSSVEHILMNRMIDDTEGVRTILESRASAFLTDPELLRRMFREKRLAEYVYGENVSFESIRAAVKGMFYLLLTNPAIGQYIADKSLEEFLCLEGLAGNFWIATEVAQAPKLIKPLLDNQNNLLAKLLQSKEALGVLFDDSELEQAIVSDASVRKNLMADTALKETILKELGSFDSLQALQSRIKDRVRQ